MRTQPIGCRELCLPENGEYDDARDGESASRGTSTAVRHGALVPDRVMAAGIGAQRTVGVVAENVPV